MRKTDAETFSTTDSATSRPPSVGTAGLHSAPAPASAPTRRRVVRSRSTTATTIVYGLLATAIFYLIAPRIPGTSAFVQRYFCGHPLEYIATSMFFAGVVILWNKFRGLSAERAALAGIQQLPDLPVGKTTAESQLAAIDRLQRWTTESNPAVRQTVLVRRIEDTLHYIRGRQDGSLEEHLRYLADLATDRLHQSFALMRTISWAIPILGFLGTVMGITIAIANVTPEQLDSSLPEVTGGLAVAFDTTAQALAMSIVLVFGSFLVERGEQSILNEVEQFGIDCLLNWLRPEDRGQTSQQSPQSLFSELTRSQLELQAQAWGQHLSELQSGWSNALATQTRQLNATLDQETQATLQIHRNSMEDARDTYAATLQQSSQQFSRQLQQTLESFGTRIDLWQEAIKTSSLASAQQSEELHRLGRTLLQLTESEQRLIQLQQQLNDNLQSLQIVDTLEQTVSSLNAAVHVLTAKTHLRNAA